MKARIATAITAFIAGIAVSILVENKVRHLIQYLFRHLTHNAIRFQGKDFHLFYPTYYYLLSGASFLLIAVSWFGLPKRKIFISAFTALLLFCASLVCICWIVGNSMIVECTACRDGIRRIYYGDVYYHEITAWCIIVATIPAIIHRVLAWRARQPDAAKKQ